MKHLLFGLVGIFWFSAAPARAQAAASPPNVVIFLPDDQGWGDLGAHGNPYVQTPNLDEFARQAVQFERFYVSPVCSPTRASLMTGRWNFRTGVCNVAGGSSMDPQEVTLAEVLRAGGYVTGIFGKWHLGDEGPHRPNEQGFDESLVFKGSTLPANMSFDPTLLHNDVPTPCKGYCMDVYTEAAIAFVRQNRSKPFFLYLPTNLVHTPLNVPDALAAPFRAAGLGPKTAAISGMLASVDKSFGRLRAVLKELGLEENTLLIFTSDNGPCSGSMALDRFVGGLHGLKGTPYENGIRVPCFLRWPAATRTAARVTRPAAHIDLMPTVLEACRIPVPTGVRLDGRSLLPLLRNPSVDWSDRPLFFQWDSREAPRKGRCYAVVTERWKLVQPVGIDNPRQMHICERYSELCRHQKRGERSITGEPRYELYDLQADPGEWQDLAADQPQRVAAMKKQYEAWYDDVAARWNR